MVKASKQYNTLRKRLRSHKGFSLSELLVTLILVGLISAAVAGGVSMVARSYTKVVDRADAEHLLSTTLNKMQDELCFARVDLETPPANTVGWSFISGISGLRIRFDKSSSGANLGAYIQFVVPNAATQNTFYFTDENNKRMYVTYGNCSPVYNGAVFQGRFEISGLQVLSTKAGNPVLAELKEPVYVAAINFHG